MSTFKIGTSAFEPADRRMSLETGLELEDVKCWDPIIPPFHLSSESVAIFAENQATGMESFLYII